MVYQYRAFDSVVGSSTFGEFFEWETIPFEKYQEICQLIDDGYTYEARKLTPTQYNSANLPEYIAISIGSKVEYDCYYDCIPLCLCSNMNVIGKGYLDNEGLFVIDILDNVFSRTYIRLLENYNIYYELVVSDDVVIAVVIKEHNIKWKNTHG